MNKLRKAFVVGDEAERSAAYKKLKQFFDIVNFVDDDAANREYCGVKVISFQDMLSLVSDESIIVCSKEYYSVGDELRQNRKFDYYVFLNGFLYHTDLKETMQPVELFAFKLPSKDVTKKILFMGDVLDQRVIQYAAGLKKEGYLPYFLGLEITDELIREESPFADAMMFTTMKNYCEYIKQGCFEMVHCMGSTILAGLAMKNASFVVFENNRGSFADKKMEALVLDYIINRYLSGLVFTSAEEQEEYILKYGSKNIPGTVITETDAKSECIGEKLGLFYQNVIK